MLRTRPRPPGQPKCADVGDLYRAHAPAVARWAARLGGPGIDPEDVVHEVFLVAHRRFSEFRWEAKITTWLFRTTELVVRGHRRKARVYAWLRRQVAADRDSDQSRDGARPLSPVEELIERQRVRHVYRALDALGAKYRSLFVLFELEGLSGDEIAALTGLKVATVWVRLHRARARFVKVVNALAAREEDWP
ncbi:MAG: sigma-70 family RNA polymerase sigma factor [Pseudomonadota bacterium]